MELNTEPDGESSRDEEEFCGVDRFIARLKRPG